MEAAPADGEGPRPGGPHRLVRLDYAETLRLTRADRERCHGIRGRAYCIGRPDHAATSFEALMATRR